MRLIAVRLAVREYLKTPEAIDLKCALIPGIADLEWASTRGSRRALRR